MLLAAVPVRRGEAAGAEQVALALATQWGPRAARTVEGAAYLAPTLVMSCARRIASAQLLAA
eukprot:15161201-Alexandrium_andersonii.AAC.1